MCSFVPMLFLAIDTLGTRYTFVTMRFVSIILVPNFRKSGYSTGHQPYISPGTTSLATGQKSPEAQIQLQIMTLTSKFYQASAWLME